MKWTNKNAIQLSRKQTKYTRMKINLTCLTFWANKYGNQNQRRNTKTTTINMTQELIKCLLC